MGFLSKITTTATFAKGVQFGISVYGSIRSEMKHRRHHAPIPVCRTIKVNPSYITHEMEKPFRRSKFPQVLNGDWDTTTVPLRDRFEYQSFERHFVEGVPWDGTELYQKHLEKVGEGDSRYDSKDDLEKRCKYWDNLHTNIKKNGYKSQRELASNDFIDPLDSEVSYLPPAQREIRLNIGRDGELIFVDGLHRLCIVQLLELDIIPVWIQHRHEFWQQKRDRAVRNPDKFDTHILNHPDIQFVLESES